MISSVLFVCMGNISPLAPQRGRVAPPLRGPGCTKRCASIRPRTAGTPARRPTIVRQCMPRGGGYELGALRSREVVAADFERFDLILAMDWDNLALLEPAARRRLRHKLGRLTEHRSRHDSPVVPIPTRAARASRRCLDLVEDACDGLVRLIRRQATRA